MVGLMATSSKRAYAVPRSAAPRAPAAGHCWPGPPQETLRHSSGSISVEFLGPGAHKVLFEPSKCLWWVWGLILNVILPLLPSCWGFSFALRRGISFFGGIQHSPVYSYQNLNRPQRWKLDKTSFLLLAHSHLSLDYQKPNLENNWKCWCRLKNPGWNTWFKTTNYPWWNSSHNSRL